MTDKQQSVFFFLIVFLFACGVGLLVFRQYDAYYREKTKTDLEAAASLPVQKIPEPIVLADGRLQVDTPKRNDVLDQTFTVSGFAQGWFEGNITIKVFDASNTPLYIGNAIAGDNYSHPAPFQTTVTLTATSTTSAGKIEFNDYSAKDGSLTYQKIVNINFSSSVADVTWKQAGQKIQFNGFDDVSFSLAQGWYCMLPPGIQTAC